MADPEESIVLCLFEKSSRFHSEHRIFKQRTIKTSCAASGRRAEPLGAWRATEEIEVGLEEPCECLLDPAESGPLSRLVLRRIGSRLRKILR